MTAPGKIKIPITTLLIPPSPIPYCRLLVSFIITPGVSIKQRFSRTDRQTDTVELTRLILLICYMEKKNRKLDNGQIMEIFYKLMVHV
jgi:hypothetical protein